MRVVVYITPSYRIVAFRGFSSYIRRDTVFLRIRPVHLSQMDCYRQLQGDGKRQIFYEVAFERPCLLP